MMDLIIEIDGLTQEMATGIINILKGSKILHLLPEHTDHNNPNDTTWRLQLGDTNITTNAYGIFLSDYEHHKVSLEHCDYYHVTLK